MCMIANGDSRYYFKYIITTPNQLTAAALVIQYWCPRDKVNPGVFIAIFLVTILVVVCPFDLSSFYIFSLSSSSLPTIF